MWTDVVIGQTPLFAHDSKVLAPPSHAVAQPSHTAQVTMHAPPHEKLTPEDSFKFMLSFDHDKVPLFLLLLLLLLFLLLLLLLLFPIPLHHVRRVLFDPRCAVPDALDCHQRRKGQAHHVQDNVQVCCSDARAPTRSFSHLTRAFPF